MNIKWAGPVVQHDKNDSFIWWWWKTPKERDHLEEKGVDETILY